MEKYKRLLKVRVMNNIKIIFFDIDGTLLALSKKQLSEKTKEALRCLRDKNIILCIATGRAPITLPPLKGAEFDAYLTFNGSYCYTKKEIIYNQAIPRNAVKKVLENAEKLNRPVSIATRERLASNGKDKDLADYYSLVKLEIEVSENFEEVLKDDVYQIMLGSEEKDYKKLMEGVEGAKITAWWDRAVDVIPATTGKGVGVDRILEYFGLSRENALAFGDGSNDIEMLKTAGIGVAMGNATEDVKEIADAVCASVEEDGIYHFCVKHGLI